MKVALVYDRVNKWGGAERILLALHRIFPDAPLYTSVYSPDGASWAKSFIVHASFLQNIPYAQKSHEFFAPLMPIAFENFSFDEYDLVISITSESAKGIMTKPHTKHICILLTPTRYLWSGYEEYLPNAILRLLLSPLIWYLRTWDKIASQRPDVILSISQEVRERAKKYYLRESDVLYPPLMIEKLLAAKPHPGSYFLVVSRLSRFTSYKRVDIAIAVANKLRIPLKIVGSGDIAYFKSLAGPTIEFLGSVSDTELISLYCRSKAVIFPGKEDFGLVMAEAQAAGKPVIAYKSGGALEIIEEGKTGLFFNEQTVSSLAEALKSFHENDYNSEICKENAKKFSFAIFEQSLKRYIRNL